VCVRGEQRGSAIELQQVDGNRIDSIRLATPHRQEVIVTQAKAKPLPKLKTFVQETFKKIGLDKTELRLAHISLLIARSGVRVNRSNEAKFRLISNLT
jgi:hypothetical protein